jgi:plasmid stabilization system protein ParE
MAARPLEIHPDAFEEFKSAVVWYKERSKSAAIGFAAEVDRALELVSESPERWPSDEQGVRRFVLNRFPFAIVYRMTKSTIQIVAIAHGHRLPAYWKSRS